MGERVRGEASGMLAGRLTRALGMLLAGLLMTGCADERTTAPDSAPASVRHVVDGDTLVLDDGAAVRLIGIDAPERGACGSRQATRALEDLVGEGSVVLVNPRGVQDEDRFDRLLRYVEVRGVDTGRRQIEAGHAVARYDGRDGYDAHPREDDYREADAASPPRCG